jgi:hypothetical protein
MAENTDNQNPFEEEFDRDDVVQSLSDEQLKEKEKKPFSEEFDPGDVVRDQDEEESEAAPPESEIEGLDAPLAEEVDAVGDDAVQYEDAIEEMDMTDDERRQKYFEDEYDVLSKKPQDDLKHNKQHFEDFLVIPQIAGSNDRLPKSNLYPKETIKSENMKVEIADDPELDEENKRASVIVNRNPEGEVESIEVVCNCGEKTLIKLDYSDMPGGEESVTRVVDDTGEASVIEASEATYSHEEQPEEQESEVVDIDHDIDEETEAAPESEEKPPEEDPPAGDIDEEREEETAAAETEISDEDKSEED